MVIVNHKCCKWKAFITLSLYRAIHLHRFPPERGKRGWVALECQLTLLLELSGILKASVKYGWELVVCMLLWYASMLVVHTWYKCKTRMWNCWGRGVYVSAAHLKVVQVTAFECSFVLGWISDYCHSHSPDCCVATKRNKGNTWWSHDSTAIWLARPPYANEPCLMWPDCSYTCGCTIFWCVRPDHSLMYHSPAVSWVTVFTHSCCVWQWINLLSFVVL